MTLEIKNKRSSTLNSAPTAAQLEDGEIGINYNASSIALYIKDTNGDIRKIAGDGSQGQYWNLSGTTLSPDAVTYGLDIGGGDIVLNADGTAAYSGKVTSAATVAGDGDSTLTTKGYVDAVAASEVRVTKIIAGTNVTIDPTSGTGDVTINASGGGSAGIQWNIDTNGSIEYIFEGPGFDPSAANPTLYVIRGQTYIFNKTVAGHPFQLQLAPGAGQSPYALGVTGNQPIADAASITWEVPMDAPAVLHYACTAHPEVMTGTVYVLNEGGGGGGVEVQVGDTPPDVAATPAGTLFWSSTATNLYILYADTDGKQWVEASPSGGGGSGDQFWVRNDVAGQGTLSPADPLDNLEVGGDGLCVIGRRVGVGRHPATEENDPQLQVGGDAEIGGSLVVDVGNFEGSLASFSVGTNRDGEGAQDGGHLGIWYTTPTDNDPGGANIFTSTGPIRICTDGALQELESSITLGGGLNPAENNWLVLDSDGNANFSGSITAAGILNVGDNPDNPGESGTKIFPSGTVRTRGPNNTSTEILFEGYAGSDSDYKFRVDGTGAVTAKGNIESDNFLTSFDFAGDEGCEIGKNINIRRNSGSQALAVYNGGTSAANITARINGDGSLFAANACQFAGGDGYSTNETAGISSSGCYRSRNDSGAVANCFEIYKGGDSGGNVTLTLANDGMINSKGIITSNRPANTDFCFVAQNAGTNNAIIRADGTYFGQNTDIQPISSERRLKENIVPIDSEIAWETIKNTPYYAYNFIGSESTVYGPMADEVPAEMVVQPMEEVVIEEAVEPVIGPKGKVVKKGKEAVTEIRPRSDEKGPIRSYDNGMLQGRLYTALQSALTRIEALEAQLSALQEAN